MRKILFLCFFLFFAIYFIHAQDYYFKHYEVEEGLSNNTVLTSLQDQDGFMWFGTKDGLNRFDGYHFKTYRSNSDPFYSLGSNYIQSLHEYKDIIWVGTDRGLYQYNKKLDNFRILNEAINDRIAAIEHDKYGNIWFISGSILYKYSILKKETTIFNPNNYFIATSLTRDVNGEIWVSSLNKIYHYSEENLSFESISLDYHNSTKSPHRITVIYALDKNNILIGTKDHGVLNYNRINKNTSTLSFGAKVPLFIRQFSKKDKNEVWITTESGVFIYNIDTNKYINLKSDINDPFSISDNASYSITIDKENGVWIGTYFGGINYHQKQYTQFKKFFPKKKQNSISGNAVREIHKDDNGDFWIGTEDAGLNKFNPKTQVFTSYQLNDGSGLSYYNIHALMSRKDNIWIGTFEHGLDVLNKKTGKVIKHYEAGNEKGSLKSNFIFSFYETKSKDFLVLTSVGIYKYNTFDDNFNVLKCFPESMHYTSFLEDNDGNYWAGTYRDGLLFYNPKNNKKEIFIYKYKNTAGISNNAINSIYQDSKNRLWIATENGLNLFDKKTRTFVKYNTKKGFPSNVFYSILEGDKNKLWITTSKGLLQFSPSNNSIKIYTTANGLLSDQFNYNSAFKDTNGDMYFGNLNGMISFNPKNFTKSKYVPKIFITGLQINNQDVQTNDISSPLKKSTSYLDELELEHNQSSFNIEFSSLNYTGAELTEYWYKLENVNKDWVYLERNNKVFFTELPPGKYVFKVKSLNSFGVWSKEIAVKIEILPPFWASNYAYLLYIILFCYGLFLIIRYSNHLGQQRNNRKIKHLNDQKEKEIYQAKIEFFTNVAHEIKTPLTLIKSPLEKLLMFEYETPEIPQNLSIMKKNTSRLLKLVNELLDFRKTEIGGLKLTFVEVNISSIIRKMHLRFSQLIEEKDIDFELELNEKDIYAFVDKEALKKIFSNLFNNAIKYSENKVIVSLSRDEKKLKLIVKNDGNLIPYLLKEKIFEPFFRVDNKDNNSGTGIGLSLAHSLTQLHNGSLQLVFFEPEMNVFELVMPLHQDEEFMLYDEYVKDVDSQETKIMKTDCKNEKTTVLIVEDSEDLLNFISKELQTYYVIFNAHNGEEALEIIHNENISLVISDIGMPIMNGITLCKKIKTNLETSHIPVILLTAKNSLKSQIDGLEVGADSYIAKPFSMEYLKVQSLNLIENRKQIMKHYASSPLSHIKSIAHNKTDEAFLKKLDEEIIKNITDQNLSVESLSEIMNMSRSTLYRKIKDISNLSPNELINIVRLKKAAELLLNQDYKMYEIAEMVGYKSQTSFGRNFQKHFKMSPKEYTSKKI